MKSITEIQEEIIAEFSVFDDKMDRYEYIIDMGKSLTDIDDDLKTDDALVKGCQSKVWLHASKEDDKIKFTASSDAIIVKGLIAILLRVFSDQKAEDIIKSELSFISKIGLDKMLSMNRTNGLFSMVKQMKFYALAYQSTQV